MQDHLERLHRRIETLDKTDLNIQALLLGESGNVTRFFQSGSQRLFDEDVLHMSSGHANVVSMSHCGRTDHYRIDSRQQWSWIDDAGNTMRFTGTCGNVRIGIGDKRQLEALEHRQYAQVIAPHVAKANEAYLEHFVLHIVKHLQKRGYLLGRYGPPRAQGYP